MMVEAAGAMRDGGPALGAGGNWSHLRSFEGVVPKTTDWRTLGDVSADAKGVRSPVPDVGAALHLLHRDEILAGA